MLTLAERDGRIQVGSRGFFDEQEVRRHFDHLFTIVARYRRTRHPVVAIIDLRSALTQSARVASLILESTTSIYSNPSDKVAIVVASAILMGQLRRVHASQGFGIFTSMTDAMTFLE